MTKRQLPNRPGDAPHTLGHLHVHASPGARYINKPTLIATITMPVPRQTAVAALSTQRTGAPVLTGMHPLAAELLRLAQVEADLSRLVNHEDSPFLTIGAQLPLDLEIELDGEPAAADFLDGERAKDAADYHAYASITIGTGRMQSGEAAVLQCMNGPIYCHIVIEHEAKLADGDWGADGPFLHTDTSILCEFSVFVSPRAELTLEEWSAAGG